MRASLVAPPSPGTSPVLESPPLHRRAPRASSRSEHGRLSHGQSHASSQHAWRRRTTANRMAQFCYAVFQRFSLVGPRHWLTRPTQIVCTPRCGCDSRIASAFPPGCRPSRRTGAACRSESRSHRPRRTSPAVTAPRTSCALPRLAVLGDSNRPAARSDRNDREVGPPRSVRSRFRSTSSAVRREGRHSGWKRAGDSTIASAGVACITICVGRVSQWREPTSENR